MPKQNGDPHLDETLELGEQPLGLDIGTSRIVVARNHGKRIQCEAQLNAFVALPYSELTETLLNRENVFFEMHGSQLIVAGDEAARFAEIFRVETRRPMVKGVLNTADPHSLRVIRKIITQLVGKAAAGSPRIAFSVPAPTVDAEKTGNYHELLFQQILTDLGYDPRPIQEGLAVVFAELAASNYTGVAISCGSGLCNVCLAALSLPVISFSTAKAGDYIDAQTATATGERAARVRLQKEQSFQLTGFATDLVQNVLTVYHDDVIRTLVTALRDQVAADGRLPRFDQSIPLVLTGGTAMPKGFLERFERAVRTENLPIPLSEIRVSGDPLNATARGALIGALHESPARGESATA